MSKQALYDRGVGRDYATVTIGEKTKDGKIVIHELLSGRDAERWIEENVGDSDPSAWLRRWEAVGRLLGARALIEIVVGNGYHAKYEMTLGGAIKWGRTQRGKTRRVCVALFDGTIVREWGPK